VSRRRRLRVGDWLERAAVVVAALVILVAVVGPFVAPHDPYRVALDQSLQPPSAEHWFGTDADGRDVFSRVLAGARVTLLATFVVIAVATVIGVVLGTAAALGGRIVDEILMRICDIGLSFPAMILALGLAAAMGPSLESAVIALALTWWPGYARLVRTLVRETLHAEYVDAARSIGMSRWRLITRHVLPNSLDTLYVQITLDVAAVILVISGLSFVGVGAQPPSAEWGALVAAGRNNVVNGWWVVALPGAAIALTAIAFNLVGDRLRVRNDPTLGNGGKA
jgi:peptide/nickel transport system permease protein